MLREHFNDAGLGFIKRLGVGRTEIYDARGNKLVVADFNGLCVALFTGHFIAEDALKHMVVKEFGKCGIRHLLRRHVLHRFNLHAVLVSHRLQAVALLVHHVGEVFGFRAELLLGVLFLIKTDDLVAHFGKRPHVLPLDVRDFNDVEPEVGFNRPHDFTLLRLINGFFKGRNHHTLTEPVEVTAVFGAARVSRVFLRKFRKLLGIGLDFLQNLFGLFLCGVLTVLQINEDVRGTALFRGVKAVAVLSVERFNVFLGGFYILKEFRREHNVLNVGFIGHCKRLRVLCPVVLGFGFRDRHALFVVVGVKGHHFHRALFGKKLVDFLHNAFRGTRGTREGRGEQLTGDVLADALDKILIGIAGGREVILIELSGKFAVFLESRIGLDDFNRGFFGNRHKFLGNLTHQRPLIHDALQHRPAAFGRIKKVTLKVFTESLAQIVKLLALDFVILLRRDGDVIDFGNGAVVTHHTVVGINTRDYKARNHKDHGDKHQPALVVAEKLKKHCVPFNAVKITNV